MNRTSSSAILGGFWSAFAFSALLRTVMDSHIRRSVCLLLLAGCLLVATQKLFKPTTEQLNSIFVRFYDGATADQYVDQPANNAGPLVEKMDTNKPTVFYIHGFKESTDVKSVLTVAGAYLKRQDHNVIAADYRNISNQSYPLVVSSVYDVGIVLAGALNEMVEAGLKSATIHVVGHSMGAQIAGHIGRQTSFIPTRITGLDPAGPAFYLLQQLSAADARFVDIINTDCGFYGTGKITGTVNFLPNGGHRVQPGCPYNTVLLTPEDFCSHRRSWEFFAESVNSENAFLAVECSNEFEFVTGHCSGNQRVVMGFATPDTARGTFYLTTAAHPEYGLGVNGTNGGISDVVLF